MNEKNKNLIIRLGTAAVLLPVVLWLLGKGGFWTGGLIAWAAGTCAYEYYLITAKKLSPIYVAGILVAALLPLLPPWVQRDAPGYAFWVVAIFFIAAWGWTLFHDPLPDGPTRAAHLLMGVIYPGAGLTALSMLRQHPHGIGWIVCALGITWLNDTGAYFAGRAFGKHKLYPLVSPNKTWEGFAGGMAGSVVGMFGIKLVYFHQLTALDCVLVGVLGGFLGPLGDFCESMLKRAYNVKDSGNIMPGHGGLLDRIDALLFNGPMVYLYVYFLRSAL